MSSIGDGNLPPVLPGKSKLKTHGQSKGEMKVVIVDDHGIVRTGLRALLQREGLDVIGEAASGRAAVEMVKTLAPDIVVMDFTMPELNGVDATRQITAARPGVKVIGLSASADDRIVVEMIRAGAAGYVPKVAAYEELIDAIRTVLDGRVYFSPAVLSRATENASAVAANPSAFVGLSHREREVLQLIAEGKATKEIASALHVSVKTVETHRRNLMEKLRLDGVAELTKYAIREGLTSV